LITLICSDYYLLFIYFHFSFYYFYIYSHVYIIWATAHPYPILSSCFPILLKRKPKSNKKDIGFLLVWDKYSYTERLLVVLPCTCVLQPTLVDLYQTSSLLPGPLPIVASASLWWLYLLLYSEHINHIQGFWFSLLFLFLPCIFFS
jgi:hypothetical protein